MNLFDNDHYKNLCKDLTVNGRISPNVKERLFDILNYLKQFSEGKNAKNVVEIFDIIESKVRNLDNDNISLDTIKSVIYDFELITKAISLDFQ